MKKNQPIIKTWNLHNFQKWLTIGNLLLAYSILLIVLARCVGYTKPENPLTNDELIGFIIIDVFCWLLTVFFITYSSIHLYGDKIHHKVTFFLMLFLPFVGSIVNYILLKKLIARQKQLDLKNGVLSNHKEPMSVQMLLVIVTLVVVLTIWLVYACLGHTQRDNPDYNPIDPIQPEKIDNVIPGLLDVLLAPINGFIEGAEVIIYLLIMGIFLQVVNSSKALEAGIGHLVKKIKGKELIIIPIIMILFSICGATFGMCEETIAFYAIVMPLVLAAGFDGIVGVFIILFGAGLGVCSSIINPFMIMTSIDATNQTLGANYLNLSDGMVFRVIVYVVFVAIGIVFVMLYARKVKNNPKKSLVYEYRNTLSSTFKFDKDAIPLLTAKRKIVLIIFLLTFVLLIMGAIPWHDLTGWNGFINANDWLVDNFPFLSTGLGSIGAWYLSSFAFLFLTATVIISALHWQGGNHFIKEALTGAKDFLGVCFVIAISRGLSSILTSSGFGDLIAHGVTKVIGIDNYFGTFILFIVFIAISIFIPSTSGFAYTVFGPIAAPAMAGANMPSIASGIASSSIANGLVNLSSPTAGPFVIGCEMAKVPLAKFYKLAWKLLLILFVVGLGLLLLTCIPGMPTSIIGK